MKRQMRKENEKLRAVYGNAAFGLTLEFSELKSNRGKSFICTKVLHNLDLASPNKKVNKPP